MLFEVSVSYYIVLETNCFLEIQGSIYFVSYTNDIEMKNVFHTSVYKIQGESNCKHPWSFNRIDWEQISSAIVRRLDFV